MNYAELTQAIKDYCSNTESSFVANIPVFVKQAEQRIYNSVDLPVEWEYATLTATPNVQDIAMPANWLATFSMSVVNPTTSDRTYLINKDYSFVREAFPDPTDTGVPQYYAISDNATTLLAPTPNAAYSIELSYYAYPTSIVTASTSWLGTNFDSVLLYGALIEAYTYMKGEADMLALYTQRYNEALAQLRVLGEGKNRQDAYRSGKTRIKVP